MAGRGDDFTKKSIEQKFRQNLHKNLTIKGLRVGERGNVLGSVASQKITPFAYYMFVWKMLGAGVRYGFPLLPTPLLGEPTGQVMKRVVDKRLKTHAQEPCKHETRGGHVQLVQRGVVVGLVVDGLQKHLHGLVVAVPFVAGDGVDVGHLVFRPRAHLVHGHDAADALAVFFVGRISTGDVGWVRNHVDEEYHGTVLYVLPLGYVASYTT